MHLLFDNGAAPITLLDYLSRGSVITFLIIIVYGGYKRWWVFGWVHQDALERIDVITREKNAWRETALKSSNIATKAFDEARRRELLPGGD